MDILGVAPWAIGSAGVAWVGQLVAYRSKRTKERNDHDDRLEIHRDDLTFDLLKHARTEMSVARTEIEGLRSEVQTLRSFEQHFFHFEQALEHLETIMRAKTPDERAIAERNARAFVNRMRRLADAKGTIRNEVQATESSISVTERNIGDIK